MEVPNMEGESLMFSTICEFVTMYEPLSITLIIEIVSTKIIPACNVSLNAINNKNTYF